MSTHTIQDELTKLANRLGIDVSGSHNIKDVIRKMNQAKGGNSNGRGIADAVRNLKQTTPFPIADPPSAFSIANVTFTPSFDDDIYSYIGTISGENESGALTFTKASGTEVTITFNGDEVETGDTLEFVNGANVLVATITQEDVAPVTYTVTFPFQRVAKDLTALAVTNVTLDPTFAGTEYEYEGAVSAGEIGGTITWTAAENNTVVATFNGDEIEESGTALAFEDGDNNITIHVQREDSEDKVYTIDFEFTRPYAADLTALTASGLTLDPTFAASTYTYTATASGTAATLTWTAASNTTVAGALNTETTITSGTEFELAEGANTITLTVSREGYQDRVYTITIPEPEDVEESDSNESNP